MASTIPPNTNVLAAPEKLMGNTTARINPYLDLLSPNDKVLNSRGGIANLDVYRELLRDDQVAATFQQRRLALTSCETVVEPGGTDALSVKAADALREQINALNWDDITDKMLYSVFYGWGIGEVIWSNGGGLVNLEKIIVRDRSRFRFGYDSRLYLTTGKGLELMPDRKFWTISTGADNHDEPYGLGLAHSLYWVCYFKRNDIKFWLTFLEKFGQPTALAKIPAGKINDPETVQKALEMLQAISTDAGIVVPDDAAVELLEAARSGAADYATLASAMDSAIAKIILSQTMTTDNGSSKSQAVVHAGVKQEVVAADSDLICESFNRQVAKWFTEYNFDGAKTPKVYRNTSPEEDLLQRAERDAKIYSFGFEPTDDYILDTYGEGFQRKAATLPPSLGGNPLLRNDDADNSPEFAEREQAALAAIKTARRLDQDTLIDAARQFAEQYETIMGRRVGQLLEAADFSEDYETFARRLDEIMAERPPLEAVDKLTRANFFAKLAGIFRGQK